jgi:thiamine kinase-like enzyme
MGTAHMALGGDVATEDGSDDLTRAIASIEQITPAWLTAALGDNYLAKDDFVVSCRESRIAVGEGFSGRLYRLFLTFNIGSPSTLIAKLAAADGPIKQNAVNAGTLYREARFYEQIGPRVGIGIPVVYYCAYGGDEFVIIMEDLGDIELGAEGLDASIAETERAFTAIGQFHAQWWNHEVTKEDWLAPADHTADKEDITRALEGTLEKHAARYPYLARCIRVFLKHLPKIPMDMESPPPVTMIHGDFHRKNVHFRADGSLSIFDWQSVEANKPVTDIANWLLLNLETQDRQAHEARLLQHYHSSLGQACTSGYSLGKLKADYRQALLSASLRMYYILETVELDVEGAEGLAEVYLQRMEQAAKDHRLLIIFRLLGLLVLMARLQSLFARE